MGFGDILKVPTSGALPGTASQDRLTSFGETASHRMAETDLGRMNRYKSMIIRVGNSFDVDPALIAGIISRESRAGNALQNGWGDNGKAWGLMQVDVTPSGGNHRAQGAWDSEEHLRQGTKILVDFIKVMSGRDGWSKLQGLKGGIAAYNAGDLNIGSYSNVDANTTGGDYSNDVVARAQWYKKHGGF